jgi:hypothetical protein
MNQESLISAFNTYKKYIEFEFDSFRNTFNRANPLVDKFMEKFKFEYDKLPYQINVFNDLRTNENAHSLFLVRLLQNKEILLHFFEFLNKKFKDDFEFDVSKINSPRITAEEQRIDALIIESTKYAIILENKIHDAVEQEHQIGRYIEKCIKRKIDLEKIYILYLSREGYSPSVQSWGSYIVDLFKRRFLSLSYKNHILEWLEILYQKLDKKEILLKSALTQYIDHLKHLFKKNNHTHMDNELQQFLMNELGLTDNKGENIKLLNKKISEFNKIQSYMNDLKVKNQKECFKEWEVNLKNRGINIFSFYPENCWNIGTKMYLKDYYFTLLIEFNRDQILVGISSKIFNNSENKVQQILKDKFTTIIQEEELQYNNDVWYGYKYTSFERGYERFIDIYNKIKEIIGSD